MNSDQRFKILHVIETLSPRYGGPVSVLLPLAKAQLESGHEVTIATTNTNYPNGVLCDPGWGNVSDSLVPVLYSSVQFTPLRFSRDLMAYLKRNISQFDIVHINGLYRFPSTYAAWQARRQNIPYIIKPHGSLDPYLYERSSAGHVWLKRLYERLFDLPNLRGASALHFVTEEERRLADYLDLDIPSFVISSAVDWAKYQRLPPRGALRIRLGLGERPVVLFLGRLHFKKGLDLLISAFSQLRSLAPEAQLVIAGPENDDYGRHVRDWVREHGLEGSVHFAGSLEGTDVVQAYVDSDVFVLPSYTENFGMTVVEAMACALPVVISDQVNIHAEVSRAGAGLVTRCDADEVAVAINELLHDPERRRTMGNAGRKLVQAQYTWPSIVDALTDEYTEVIERHSSGQSAHCKIIHRSDQ